MWVLKECAFDNACQRMMSKIWFLLLRHLNQFSASLLTSEGTD